MGTGDQGGVERGRGRKWKYGGEEVADEGKLGEKEREWRGWGK